MQVLTITNENFKEEVLNSDKTVLVDFYATWCGPCRMLSPIVDEYAEETQDVKVCKLNVDEAEQVAMNYGVNTIPTLIVFKNGELYKKSVGLVSKQEIENLVK